MRHNKNSFFWSTGIAVALGTLVAPLAGAQEGRLNKIIEQFENGEPSLVGEHWQRNDL